MKKNRTWRILLVCGLVGNLVGAGLYLKRRLETTGSRGGPAPVIVAVNRFAGVSKPTEALESKKASAAQERENLTSIAVWKDANPAKCEVPWTLAVRRLGGLLTEELDEKGRESFSFSERYQLLLDLSPEQSDVVETALTEILQQKRAEQKLAVRMVELEDGGKCVELAVNHARDQYWFDRALASLPTDLKPAQSTALMAALAQEPRFQLEGYEVVRVYVEQNSNGSWSHFTESIGTDRAGRNEDDGPWTPYSFLLPEREQWVGMARKRTR